MNDIREALMKILSEDATIQELAPAGVWFEKVDQDAPGGSAVIFSQVSGRSDFAFDGDPLQPQHWDVKGVGPTKIAGQIDDRCRELLTDADLSIPNRDTLLVLPGMDINYPELTNGEPYQHVGATYAITTERTES